MVRATVVIPTWNGAGLLNAALSSLREQTWLDFEIVVVDNGSRDGTPEMLGRDYPEVHLIRFSENRGFAEAVNAGIRACESEFVVLMNNDVEADSGWLAALVRILERRPDVGACASRMLRFDDRSRIDSAGDQMGFFAYSIGHGEQDGPPFHHERSVFSASAGAAAYRRSALEEVGLFDERFFAYLEDVDLGIRLQLAGWDCVYVPEAVVYHHGSATARRMPERKLYLLMRNSLYLFFQYFPLPTVIAYGPAMLGWPFYRGLRERQPLRVPFRALRDFLADAPAVLRRRRLTRRTRRLADLEFRRKLTGWLGHGWRAAPGPAPDERNR